MKRKTVLIKIETKDPYSPNLYKWMPSGRLMKYDNWSMSYIYMNVDKSITYSTIEEVKDALEVTSDTNFKLY